MHGNFDYKALRSDLINQYGAAMVTFSGVMGFSDMPEADHASNAELLQLAKERGMIV